MVIPINSLFAIAQQPPFTAVFSVNGPLSVLAGTTRYYFNRAAIVTNVRASVGTAPTGASVIVDVNKNGSTIYSTQANRPTIAASGFTDTGNTPNTTAFAADDYLTVDVDQIGSTIPGSDLTVQIEFD